MKLSLPHPNIVNKSPNRCALRGFRGKKGCLRVQVHQNVSNVSETPKTGTGFGGRKLDYHFQNLKNKVRDKYIEKKINKSGFASKD